MVSSGILAIFVLLFRCVQRPDLNIERRDIKRDGKHRGIAEGKWIFSFLYKWVINHLSFTYSLTITHAIFLLMWQRNNYRWKMACLFILYTDLVPHLHDLKNDVSSCPAKRELAAQDVSVWDYGKDCWDEQQGNNQSLVPCFFFCQEWVTVSQSWAGTRGTSLVLVFQFGGPGVPPNARVSEGTLWRDCK